MAEPLSRNRNYHVLWLSRASSEIGSNTVLLALPLMVLALTGSPAAAGAVTACYAVAQLAGGLPAGALADRYSRKGIMLACEAVRAIAAGTLVAGLAGGFLTIAHVVAAVLVLGLCSAVFEPAEEACLPSVVPAEQLHTAVGLNGGRSYFSSLVGTASGGFLFSLRNFAPFLLEAVSHVLAFVLLLFLRLPRRNPVTERQSMFAEVLHGVRWMLRHRQIRIVLLCAVSLNLMFQALFLVVVLAARERGVGAGQIGVMVAMLGVGGLIGSVLAGPLGKRIGPYASIVGVLWALALLAPLLALSLPWWGIGLLLAGMTVVAPTANITVTTFQMLLTPDHLRGRVSAGVGVAAGSAQAIGTLAGGLLLEHLSGGVAVVVCAVAIAVLALVFTANPVLRGFPREVPADDEPVPVTTGGPP